MQTLLPKVKPGSNECNILSQHIVQHCWHLLRLVAFFSDETGQTLAPNFVGLCCDKMLRPFQPGFKKLTAYMGSAGFRHAF